MPFPTPFQQPQQQPDFSALTPEEVLKPSTERYDYASAIRRRLGYVNDLGEQQNSYVADRALRADQQRQQSQMQQMQQQQIQGAYQSPQYGGDVSQFRQQLIKNVSQYAGTPYKWGGAKPGGFDCSGLVQFAYGQAGIKLPRVSQQQAPVGRVVPINQLKPGDLVGWGNSPSSATHIAVYAGNGQVWEAPRAGASVRLRPLTSVGFDRNAFGVSLANILGG